MKKILSLLLIITSLVLLFNLKPLFAQEQPLVVQEMEDKSETIILENGDAKVKEVISMSATAFANFRQRYPVLSSFTRMFKPMNLPIQVENLKIDMDEANNQIVVDYLMKGASINRGDHWALQLLSPASGQRVDLLTQTGNTLVFNQIGEVTQGTRIVTTVTLKFPEKAKNINFDSSTNTVKYELPGKLIEGEIAFLILGIAFLFLGILSFILPRIKKRKKLA